MRNRATLAALTLTEDWSAVRLLDLLSVMTLLVHAQEGPFRVARQTVGHPPEASAASCPPGVDVPRGRVRVAVVHAGAKCHARLRNPRIDGDRELICRGKPGRPAARRLLRKPVVTVRYRVRAQERP